MIPEGFVRLLSREQIERRVRELAAQLRAALEGKEVTVVGILDGALFFLTDLLRELRMNVQIDFLRVSSYEGGETNGRLRFLSELTWNVVGRSVILVDDILDTGQTLHFCREHLLKKGAAEVRNVVLLAKERRLDHPVEVELVGFPVPDRFVIGYGLDWQGRYRQLPEIFAKETR